MLAPKSLPCPLCETKNPSGTPFCRACGTSLPQSPEGENGGGESGEVLPAQTILGGSYRVESVLGQGGFGITYRGHDQMLDRATAIKEFFPSGCRRENRMVVPARGWTSGDFLEARTQFLAEARLLARCHHPGIVGVYSAFEENGTAYMVMELLVGATLGQHLEKSGGRLKEGEAVEIVESVGQALGFVHERGLLHRDIKPDNILICDDGRRMLLDFGTAREVAQNQNQAQNHSSGQSVLVTPGYAPLEQYARQAKRGAFTDIYGLAATLYHLLTGGPPPPASDRARGVLLRPVRALNPEVSPSVAHAVEAGLQMEIAKRPQSVGEFLELLHAPVPQAPPPALASPLSVPIAPPDAASATQDYLDEIFGVAPGSTSNSAFPSSSSPAAKAPAPAPFAPVALQPMDSTLPGVLKKTTPQNASSLSTNSISTPSVLPASPTASGGAVQIAQSAQGGGWLTLPVKVAAAVMLSIGGLVWLGSRAPSSTSSHSVVVQSGPTNSGFPSRLRARDIVSSPPFSSPFEDGLHPMARQIASLPLLTPVENVELPRNAPPARGSSSAAYSPSSKFDCAEFSADGRFLAYSDDTSTIRVWDVEKKRVLRTFAVQKPWAPLNLRFSPGGEFLAVTQHTQNDSLQVTVWDLRANGRKGTVSNQSKEKTLVVEAVKANGDLILSRRTSFLAPSQSATPQPPTLELWRFATQKATPLPIQLDEKDFLFAAQGDDAQNKKMQIAVASVGGKIRLMDETGKVEAQTSTPETWSDYQGSPFDAKNWSYTGSLTDPLPVKWLEFSPDGSHLLTHNELQARVLDFGGQTRASWSAGLEGGLAVSPDGQKLVGRYALAPDSLVLWNERMGKRLRLLSNIQSGDAPALSFSPDGQQLHAVVRSYGISRYYRWRLDGVIWPPFSSPDITNIKAERRSMFARTLISPDGQLVAQASGPFVEVWQSNGALRHRLRISSLSPDGMKFSPDSLLLAVLSLGPKGLENQLWNMESGEKVAVLPLESNSKNADKPDRKNSTRTDSDRSDSDRSDLDHINSSIRQIAGMDAMGLAFSSNHQFFAGADRKNGKDGVSVWRLEKTPRKLAFLPREGGFGALLFSPDNNTLFYGDLSGTLRSYNLLTRQITQHTKPQLNAQSQPNSAFISGLFWSKNQLIALSQPPFSGLISDGPSTQNATQRPRPRPGASVSFYEVRPGKTRGALGLRWVQNTTLGSALSWGRVAISPDGALLAAWMPSGIQIWALPSGAPIQKLQRSFPIFGPNNGSLIFSGDGKSLFATGQVRDFGVSQFQLFIARWTVPKQEISSPNSSP